jgi:hypothetical protein
VDVGFRRRGGWGSACLWLVLGCGGRSEHLGPTNDAVPLCVPGAQVTCGCPAARTGVQRCGYDGTFGACDCATGSSRSDSSSASGGTGSTEVPPKGAAGRGGSGKGGSGGAAVEVDTAAVDLLGREDELIDAFVTERGIIIIDTSGVRVVDRSGRLLVEKSMPRPLTSAAFDGELLVVTDAAKLTTFDLELNEKVSANLAEGCVSSVLLSEHRFVCGPENDWDRVFYTYDLESGALLASSKKYTYNGIPMRRVPGKDDFVCVTVDSSPSDFHLYSLLPSGEASFVNESPYHGDFRVTDVYAFTGFPATHLVTDAGLLLKIYAANCSAEENSFNSECFVKDGALGTLTGSQVFLGMDQDQEGRVYGLVSLRDSFSEPGCAGGCLLQQIDVPTRGVLEQMTIKPSLSKVVALRYDAFEHGVALGSRNVGSRSDYPGYQVRYYSLD